jgi:hypothetical protein
MSEKPSTTERLSEAKQRLLELQRRGNLKAPAVPSEPKHRAPGPAPLSLSQEQVWRHDLLAGKLAPLYNESITLHRRGPCDAVALEKAFAEIIRRHEIWRTTFEVRDGQPLLMVNPAPASFRLPTTDLRKLPQSEREKAALAAGSQDARPAFDLSRGPLLRARLVTLADDEHKVFLTAHQSIVDGTTVYDVFPSELTALYEAFASGKPSPLPELEVQFADFACWQRQRLTSAVMERQLAYWQKQLSGELPVLQWPNQGARPTRQTYRGAIQPFTFSKEFTQSLRDSARREGVTLFMVLLSGLLVLLHRYTRQDDIIVGTLAPSGRKQPEFQRLLGYFLNPVPLRANLSGNPGFRSLLHQVREITLGAISNDDLPIEYIAEKLQLKPDPSRNLFFTVALSVAPDVPPLPPGWNMTFMDVESGGARWDLYLELNDRAEGIMGRAQYNPDIFAPATITQTVRDLQVVLQYATADPTQLVDQLAARLFSNQLS